MGINLTKVLSVLSTENYRTILRENKDLNKWGDKTYSWIRKLNVVKMSVLPKLTYSLKKNSNQDITRLKFLLSFEIVKLILKCIRKCQGQE